MPAWTLPCRDQLEVDENRTGDMTREIFVATSSSDQVPAKVNRANILVTDVSAQPIRFDQRPKAHPAVTTCVS
jgi:hypothetical protein